MSKFVDVPKAQEFASSQNEKRNDQRSKFDKAQEKRKARLQAASDEMLVDLTSRICSAIKEAQEDTSRSSLRVVLKLIGLDKYQGIPGDVLLYGHRDGDWRSRTSLDLKYRLIERLQALFFERGWYLIEESDPSRGSRIIVFALYADKPNKPYYFNQPGKLWHNNNLFDEELIRKIIEEGKAEETKDVQKESEETEDAQEEIKDAQEEPEETEVEH